VSSRALVLAGGGVTGIAWEMGIAMGLHEAGIALADADLIVGTSAGSTAGAQLRSGVPIDDLYATQLSDDSKERTADLDLAKFVQMRRLDAPDPATRRAMIGEIALSATTIPEAERREIIAARLPVHEWPEEPLLITAVDTASGEFVVFDRNSGVSLVDAVAASCAVPAVWPPVTIGTRRYMDGGARSSTNADLAVGHDVVLIVTPYPLEQMLSGNFEDERAVLEPRSRIVTIVADEASKEAAGMNPLDASRRAPAAMAGLAQGHVGAEAIRDIWGA
jgi:NTE family protein